MAYGLGIDVGMAFTAAAIGDRAHHEMVPLGDSAIVAPSVVFADADGQLITGDAAVRRAHADPSRAVSEFKRRLGDPTPIFLGDRGYLPMQLIAAIVRDVVAKAVTMAGAPPATVVLTCPAIWGPYRLEQFAEVASLAELENCRTMTEPEAAAGFYQSGRDGVPGPLVAVYDLGAGTFDAAIVRMSEDAVELIGNAEGVEDVGGATFDQLLLTMIDQKLNGAVGRLDPNQPADATVLAQVRADIVRAKETLSTETEVRMALFVPDGPHEVRLTRAEFEHLIGPALDSTLEAMWRALASAGVNADQLDAILLSGGSSRIPLVTRRLQEEFNRPVRTFGHLKHVVALGAASAAAKDLSRLPVSAATTEKRRRVRPPWGRRAADPASRGRREGQTSGPGPVDWSADVTPGDSGPVRHRTGRGPREAPTEPTMAGRGRVLGPVKRVAIRALATIAMLTSVVAASVWLERSSTRTTGHPDPSYPLSTPLGTTQDGPQGTSPAAATVSATPTTSPSAPSPTPSSSASPTPTSPTTTAVQPPVEPPPFSYTGILRNWGTGNCLDGNDTGAVYQLACNGSNYQNWRIQFYSSESGGLYRIVNQQTGRCLDSSYNLDQNVYTSWCQDPNHWQKWIISFPHDNGNEKYIQFRDAVTSYCLAFPDATLVVARVDQCGDNGYALFARSDPV